MPSRQPPPRQPPPRQPPPAGLARVPLTDPRALRAVAHPTRLRLMGLLRTDGPLTATAAGELLGESSGSMSFHLRQLAKYGLVEETGDGTGRRKPWRAVSASTSWDYLADDPELAEAAVALSRVVAERYAELVRHRVDRIPFEDEAWTRAAPFGDSLLYLTAPELAALGEQVERLLEPYLHRTTNRAERPAGARRVTWLNLAFPTDR